MPFLTDAILANGALVAVRVEVSASHALALRNAGMPLPAGVQLRALLDTGADCTFIDTTHLQSLGLQNPLIVLVGNPSGGWTIGLQCEINLTLLHPAGGRSNLIIRAMPIVDRLLAPNLGYEAVVGRDVLGRCLLNYDGAGARFTLAY